jgi:putative spermidine/putrescine transport system permease protein
MIPEITFALGVARIFYAIHLANTAVGIAFAHVILAAPFAVLVLVSTFEGMDPRLLEAGTVMGCGPLRLFWLVTLPLAVPGLVAAALFSFLASYNDFVLTLMVYGADTVTLPVQTYLSLGNGYLSVASAISTILLIPSLLFLLGMLRMVSPENLVGGLKGA